MTEHVITREMLVSTLSEVMTERDAAKREVEQCRDDYSKTLIHNTKLRDQLEILEANAKLARERIDAESVARRNEYERAEHFKKQACTCALGPNRAPDENTRIKELNQTVQSLQQTLGTVAEQRDRLSNALNAAEVQLLHEQEARAELTSQRDILAQQLKIRTTERDSLHKQQCQCVPVLEAKIQSLDIANAQLMEDVDRLEKQLPAEMVDATIRLEKCAVGHAMLRADNWVKHPCPWCIHAKLRSLFEQNINTSEMLMSNPPKNIVAYRGLQILEGGI